MVTTIASRNSYSERRFLKRDWQIISYRICTMNCLISPLWLCSYCNVSPTQNVVWSYTRYSSQCCIGAIAIPSTSSWTTTKQQCWTNKNVEYQWENGFIVWDYSPLWLAPNYNPVNIIRLGYIRSIWLICTSCNSSIRCRTSRAAPFARSRCNCKEHVCKWYW